MGRLRGMDIGGGGHSHSYLHRAMYEDAMESEIRLRLRSAAYVAQSALMSHQNVDYQKAASAASSLAKSMINALDYLGGGDDAGDVENDERRKFVEQYMEMRRRMLKEQPPEAADGKDKD